MGTVNVVNNQHGVEVKKSKNPCAPCKPKAKTRGQVDAPINNQGHGHGHVHVYDTNGIHGVNTATGFTSSAYTTPVAHQQFIQVESGYNGHTTLNPSVHYAKKTLIH